MPLLQGPSRAYTLLGHVITIVAVEPAATALMRLDELLGSGTPGTGWQAASGTLLRIDREDGTWHVRDTEGTSLCQPLSDDEQLVPHLEWLAYSAAIYHADVSLLLHAGAVVRDGIALLLPNASGAGKTTLTLALATRGWLPLTDDVCPLIEQDGELVATGSRRCCHLRLPSQDLLRTMGVPVEGPLGGVSYCYRPERWGEPAAVRGIVIPRYRDDVPTSLTPITQAECMARLAALSFDQGSRTRYEQRLSAARLAARVPAFELTYTSVALALDRFGILESQLEAAEGGFGNAPIPVSAGSTVTHAGES
jgi:hypothetical protein